MTDCGQHYYPSDTNKITVCRQNAGHDGDCDPTKRCSFETCKEPASAGGEGQCERHAEALRRSRAFWTAGKLTLDPIDPSRAQLGLAGSRMELPR